MKLRISQIAELIGAEIVGDPQTEIFSLSKIEEGLPGSITFLANPKYESFIYQTQASAVIVESSFSPKKSVNPSLLKVKDPYSAFTQLLELVSEEIISSKEGIDPSAFISPSSKIGEGCYIGPFAYIGDGVKIGDNVKIFPHAYIGDFATVGDNTCIFPQATIYHACTVGSDCIVHAGACIGSDGFGFAPQEDGSFKKIPQTGNVVIENKVEIGANTCIDRATVGHTTIREGAKLDNLVQLAHNVEIGSNTVVAAQAGIAGSTRLGRNCMIGGQAGLVGHLELANQTMIDAQSGVNKSVKKEGLAFRGSPAQLHRQQLKSEVFFRKLEDMYRRIQQLEEALENSE